jgi:hypothetical protein
MAESDSPLQRNGESATRAIDLSVILNHVVEPARQRDDGLSENLP